MRYWTVCYLVSLLIITNTFCIYQEHKVWLEEANMLTNGTHEEPYPNPVVDTLEDLQSEVRDITVGFETRMRRIKREGDRTFSGEQNEGNLPPSLRYRPFQLKVRRMQFYKRLLTRYWVEVRTKL